MAEKRTYFDAHKDKFDTIFIGSSRMVSQIIPKEFDAETAAQGEPTHSFNLGCTGMWPPESFYFLRQILKLRPPHLKWAFIDLMNVDSRVFEGNAGTQRAEYWHDGRHTFVAFRDVLDSGRSPPKAAMELWKHIGIFVKRCFMTGRGSEWLETKFPIDTRSRKPEWIERDGFDPTPEGSLAGNELAHYLDTVAALKKDLPHYPMRPVFFEAVQEIAADVRRIGAEPVFILAPTINVRENYSGLPRGIKVLRFNDPTQFPILFDPAFHFDSWHLNETGAVPYTRILARSFVDWRIKSEER